MSVSEIDFREFYTSAGDLKDDENRDHYPPRFITQLNGDQQSALHLEYMLHVIKDDKTVKDYKFSISRSVPKAYKGNKVYIIMSLLYFKCIHIVIKVNKLTVHYLKTRRS